MSYEALAQARGTTKRAAVVLVRRKKWPRQKDNAGHTLALVPVTWAEKDLIKSNAISAGHDAPNGAGPNAPDAIAVLERTVEVLCQAHAEALALLQDRAQRAEAEVAELRGSVMRSELALGCAQERLGQLERADAARRAATLPARLWRAWKGR